VALEVADSGPGIAPELRPRVFERHQSGGSISGERRGNGLGLSIAKWAVEANGGQLTLENPSGTGSTFRISFPGAGAPAARQGAGVPAAAAG
jgi:signal transduction histidine kinase